MLIIIFNQDRYIVLIKDISKDLLHSLIKFSFSFPASIERFVSSLIKQKVPDNIGQDQPQENPSAIKENPYGPWYQNGWTYTAVSPGNVPYQNPPGWKRG